MVLCCIDAECHCFMCNVHIVQRQSYIIDIECTKIKRAHSQAFSLFKKPIEWTLWTLTKSEKCVWVQKSWMIVEKREFAYIFYYILWHSGIPCIKVEWYNQTREKAPRKEIEYFLRAANGWMCVSTIYIFLIEFQSFSVLSIFIAFLWLFLSFFSSFWYVDLTSWLVRFLNSMCTLHILLVTRV